MNMIHPEKIEGTETELERGHLAAVSEVEAGIRDFVRNDVAYLRQPVSVTSPEPAVDSPSSEAAVSNLNSLIQRVAGASLSEIEKLIAELESVRAVLHAEGERVQREISTYAQLSQATMKSTRVIGENVAQWMRTAEGLRIT
jgi:hypothetical protein